MFVAGLQRITNGDKSNYCQSDPPEIREDFEREERLLEASGMNDPNYKYNPSPKLLSPQEIATIMHGS